MKLSKTIAIYAAALIVSGAPLFAADITVNDAYARSATPSAKSGAAFLTLVNTGARDDILVAATTDAAKRVELHTHKDIGNGVMQMTEIEGGIPVPAGGMSELKRGGDHIMLMGLTEPLKQDLEISVTLTFEIAGEIEVQIPVDHKRKPKHGSMDHSGTDTDS